MNNIKTFLDKKLTPTELCLVVVVVLVFDYFVITKYFNTTHTPQTSTEVEEVFQEPTRDNVVPPTSSRPVVTTNISKKVVKNILDTPKEEISSEDIQKFFNGVKHWEGFRNTVYTCSGGVKTIGYGFTGKEIKNRTYITPDVAHEELVNEVIPKHLNNVDEVVKVPLNKYQRLALASFSYNLGRSNLIRLVSGKNRLNSGNYESVEKIMPLYRKSDGKVRRGLELRRSWEVDVFNGNIHTEYGN